MTFKRFRDWLRRVVCGHDFYIVQTFNTGGKRIRCVHCEAEYAISNDGLVLKWTEAFADFYRSIGNRVKP